MSVRSGLATEPEDLHLMARVSDGDAEALGALYDRLAGKVFRQAFAVLRNREDAEDVVQETFAHVWFHAAQYDPDRGSLAGWILVIARTRSLDRWRRRARHPELSLESDGRSESSEPVTALMVAGAMATLDPVQRQVIQLAYGEGYSHEEIARELQTPLGTVKGRIRTSLKILRAGPAAGGDQ